MSLVESIKDRLTADEVAFYRCDECGETFETDPDVTEPSCAACGSSDVAMVTRKV